VFDALEMLTEMPESDMSAVTVEVLRLCHVYDRRVKGGILWVKLGMNTADDSDRDFDDQEEEEEQEEGAVHALGLLRSGSTSSVTESDDADRLRQELARVRGELAETRDTLAKMTELARNGQINMDMFLFNLRSIYATVLDPAQNIGIGIPVLPFQSHPVRP